MEEDGVILIDKPTCISSFGVVARVRRVLSQQVGHKVKVGHTGTLDPFASGLMILVTGKFTKKATDFTKMDKSYDAAVVLGKTSTTCDPEGEITSISDRVPSLDEIENAIECFVGKINQKPPAFSAIKIAGQRAYKLARAGKAVDIPKREVTIYSIKINDYSYPILDITAHVSSGTYIRTLAADIGTKLSTGAYLQALRRTEVGQYSIDDAKSLQDLGVDN
jgi:tRNA pseudouridine 55 synthase